MVGSDIGSAEDGRELVLGGRYFVVLSLSADAESPELLVKIFHISVYAGLDSAEVVVFKLLTLRCGCTEKRSACKDKVFSL